MNRKLLFSLSFLALLSMYACSMFRTNVRTEVMRDEGIMTGNYTLILHGARHSEDYETIAFLDYGGDDIVFEPYAPGYDYSKKENMPGDQALDEAVKFISRYPPFIRARLSRITDLQGRVLGYELRPIYLSIMTFGHGDTLNVRYVLRDRTVVVYIRLKQALRRALERDGENTLLK